MSTSTPLSLVDLEKRIAHLEHILSHVLEDNQKMRTAIQLLSNEYGKIVGIEPEQTPRFDSFVVKFFGTKPENLESFKVIFRPDDEEKVLFFTTDEQDIEEQVQLDPIIVEKSLAEFSENDLLVDHPYWAVVYGVSKERPNESTGEPT